MTNWFVVVPISALRQGNISLSLERRRRCNLSSLSAGIFFSPGSSVWRVTFFLFSFFPSVPVPLWSSSAAVEEERHRRPSLASPGPYKVSDCVGFFFHPDGRISLLYLSWINVPMLQKPYSFLPLFCTPTSLQLCATRIDVHPLLPFFTIFVLYRLCKKATCKLDIRSVDINVGYRQWWVVYRSQAYRCHYWPCQRPLLTHSRLVISMKKGRKRRWSRTIIRKRREREHPSLLSKAKTREEEPSSQINERKIREVPFVSLDGRIH